MLLVRAFQLWPGTQGRKHITDREAGPHGPSCGSVTWGKQQWQSVQYSPCNSAEVLMFSHFKNRRVSFMSSEELWRKMSVSKRWYLEFVIRIWKGEFTWNSERTDSLQNVCQSPSSSWAMQPSDLALHFKHRSKQRSILGPYVWRSVAVQNNFLPFLSHFPSKAEKPI